MKMRNIIKLKNKDGDRADKYTECSPPEEKSILLLEYIYRTEGELRDFYGELTQSEHPEKYEKYVMEKLHSFRRTSSNINKAQSKLINMTDELSARFGDLTKGKRRRFLPKAPANSLIDLAEENTNHFARGINIYKLLLVCFIGSFFGVVLEMLWCLLNKGYIESRAGLVWGPFNLLYGIGAVALTVSLYRFRNNSKRRSFIGGFLVGSAVEYVCSFLQEMVFGSRSWDYSHMPFNINGRVCLLYSVFWGLLGVLWVKSLYPWMAKLILRIPCRIGKTSTWVLTAFLAVNAIVTVIAVFRWSQRIELAAPQNGFWELVDMLFPNSQMERTFANMRFEQLP